MAIDPKISILTFPQKLIGNTLHLNVLIIPRNIDPFQAWPETGAPAWVDADLQLQAFSISGLEKFPFASPATPPFNLAGIQIPAAATKIFSVLQTKFNIVPAPPGSVRRLQPPKLNDYARKYLPVSYRTSFNFTNPRTDDAVTDDSYHCAIKANKDSNPAFVPSTNDISWGEVFAYCLRHPDLARKVGFVQQASIVIDDMLFKDGGWLFVDIAPAGSYGTAADKAFLKRYAARIPALKAGVEDRNLFAAIQFPVKANEADADPLGFDEIFPEASAYDDGFAKIVHANQPVSADLLKEEIDDHPPIHDIGIRLAWDDEQLLIWKNRQLRPDPADITKTKRFDAPMGAFQYHIDAKEKAAANWISLNLVENRVDLAVDPLDDETIIAAAGNQNELGVEVYPAKLDGFDTSHYWLPAYFTQWTGKSLVVPDMDAAALHKTDEAGVALGNIYKPLTEEAIDLQYGKDYEFRVRLSDPTGGGPGHENIAINNPIYESPSPVAVCKFRRHVVPQPVLVRTALPKKDEFFKGSLLEVQRPRLGYPSVVFTGKYGANVINLLTADRDEAIKFVQDPVTGEITTSNREFGLHDPDVQKLEVCVEIKALEMDTLLSKTKTESYIQLYTTTRNFPDAFDGVLSIPIEYIDSPVLQFTNSPILQDMGLSNEVDPVNIHDIDQIVLPSARHIRITVKCVCHNSLNYFGNDVFRYGKPLAFMVRKDSEDETHLIKNQADTEEIKGVYLQPDTELLTDRRVLENALLRDLREKKPDLIQRLADAIGVETRGFSFVAKTGRRIQFGCSKNIRNSISPDGTSITFSTKADLLNQWIVPIKLILNRDWTWDALEVTGFEIERRQWFKKGLKPVDAEKVGDIEMKKIINVQALQKPDRSQTWLIFLDAVEPKPAPGNHPDLVELEYIIKPVFKAGHANDTDPELKFELELPVTTPPAQIPKIVSAGIAFSKYNRNKKYSASEPREKCLWLEFKEPIQDSNDAYFVRVLAYAPDPLLSDWRGELFIAPKEPPLPINPELIRTITTLQPHDNLGLDKMQEMTVVSTDPEKRHFLVPLPHGLHTDSNEMFGFFTYEIRVGHRDIWSTEQGRYGREIRTTGVQHPAPTLYCTVSRNEKKISVSAPYATTVSNGKNVTSRPPRTQIWSLLYAQVSQADGNDFRNILLNDRLMVLQPETTETIHKINEDSQAISIGGWTNKEVITLLKRYGLSPDSPLSIVCVEMLPVVFSLLQQDNDNVRSTRGARAGDINMNQILMNHIQTRFANKQLTEKELQEQAIYNEAAANYIKPLSDQLGNYRMLRTSPLTAVPAICCVDC